MKKNSSNLLEIAMHFFSAAAILFCVRTCWLIQWGHVGRAGGMRKIKAPLHNGRDDLNSDCSINKLVAEELCQFCQIGEGSYQVSL